MEKTNSGYTLVDVASWKRKAHFEAFQSFAECTFSQTVQLDITHLLKTVKDRGDKFYPTMIYLIARMVNKQAEFRMAIKDGQPITWDVMHPSYTLFHEDSETFSSVWSYYHPEREAFLKTYSQDVARYGNDHAYFPREDYIENMFFISANPWVSFTSFDFNVANIKNFFAPMFTLGKYYSQGDSIALPLAVQVHHAVCDGYHVGKFINGLQQLCLTPPPSPETPSPAIR